jgi:putative hemolysin
MQPFQASLTISPAKEMQYPGTKGVYVALFFLLFIFAALACNALPPLSSEVKTETNVTLDLFIVFLLILMNCFLVLAETAMLTVRRTRIEQLVDEGNPSAKLTAQLLSEPTRMLASLQVGLTLVQFFAAGAAAEQVVNPFSAFLSRTIGMFIPLVSRESHAIAFFVIIIIVSLTTLIIGEITPKSIAIRHSEKIALISAWPISWLQVIGSPVVLFVTALSRILTRPFGGGSAFPISAMTEEELKMMVEQSEEHGVIETEEKEMIHSIFDFADTVVRKVMTPRLDITAVSAATTTQELIHVVTESGHSRIPVYETEIDDVIGIVHIKDVIGHMTESGRIWTVKELMRPPYFIPENKRVDDLLTEMRRSKMQMALVRDEYGALAGVVTIEDLLEEIVGDIQDEYDVEETPALQVLDELTCIVDGRMNLEDFNDRMGSELPLEESDTLGGFVFGLMGHQPALGECANWDGMVFSVEATDGRSIQKVRVLRTPPAPPGSTDESHERRYKETGEDDIEASDS